MTEEQRELLKNLLIGTNIKLIDITNSYEEINKIQNIEPEMSEKIRACLGMLKAVLELMAFHHGDITGKELRNESNIPAQ